MYVKISQEQKTSMIEPNPSAQGPIGIMAHGPNDPYGSK